MKKYIQQYGNTSEKDDITEASLNETDEDIRNRVINAAITYQEQFSEKPIVKREEIKISESLLDDDIKQELKKSALDIECMWDEFEKRFGHRGIVRSHEEKSFRDPVVIVSTVRYFRAVDEQLTRLNLPLSEKTGAWLTYYKNGNVDLESAPWQF